ncbi:putative glycosyl [Golovinomyces cichoracearum]|uniref:Putative glycosyl n=1 Tax=Golovinomyces cichoracearum TaxID=62708 RepID=A0A420J973_9PEZI|nr:putative glycosyl [Golovinomyces cichoracearum]
MEQVTILINRLDKLQKSLSPEFRTDATLHDKIISACINIEACKMACYSPSPTVTGLTYDLKSGIEIFNKSLPSSSVLLAQSTSQSINQNTFFTDRPL